MIACVRFGLASALFAGSVLGSEPTPPQPAPWYLEFHEQTFEDACALANEPDLEYATVWHCQNSDFESYMVRLGPAPDRTELDRIRQRYFDPHRVSLVRHDSSCKTMERQSCPIRQSWLRSPNDSQLSYR